MLDFSALEHSPFTTIEEATAALVEWIASAKGMQKIFVIPDTSMIKIVEVSRDYAESKAKRPMSITSAKDDDFPFHTSFLMLSSTDYKRVMKKQFVPMDEWKPELWEQRWEEEKNASHA